MKILFWSQNPKLPSGMANVGDKLASQLAKYYDVVYQAQTGAEYGEEYHGYTLHGNQMSGGQNDVGIQMLGQRIAEEEPDALVTNLNWHQLTGLPQVTNGFRSKDDSMPIFLYTAVESESPVTGMKKYLIDQHKNDVYYIPYTEPQYEMWQDSEMEKFVPDFIPHGVDHDTFQEADPNVCKQFYRQAVGIENPDSCTKFVFVGENWRRKRIDILLKAFSEFKDGLGQGEDARIVLHTSSGPSHGNGLFYTGWELATGPQNPQPDPLLDTFGLELGKDVHFTKTSQIENMPEEQMCYLYSGADCFVLPTMSEGFGLPLLEAGACGTPSIVTRTDTTEWICGDSALYIDTVQENYLRKGEKLFTPSIESLKEKFKEFHEMSENEREELSRKAVKRSQEFTWRDAGRKFDELLERYQNNELPTKRANDMSSIGDEIDINPQELMQDE